MPARLELCLIGKEECLVWLEEEVQTVQYVCLSQAAQIGIALIHMMTANDRAFYTLTVGW